MLGLGGDLCRLRDPVSTNAGLYLRQDDTNLVAGTTVKSTMSLLRPKHASAESECTDGAAGQTHYIARPSSAQSRQGLGLALTSITSQCWRSVGVRRKHIICDPVGSCCCAAVCVLEYATTLKRRSKNQPGGRMFRSADVHTHPILILWPPGRFRILT